MPQSALATTDFIIPEQQETKEIFVLADRLRDLKTKKELLENQLKAVNAEIEEVNQQAVNEFVNEELQNFTRDGITFYLSEKINANPVPELKPTLFQEIKQKGFGSIIQETIHHQTFTAFVKEQMGEEDELPEWLQGKVNVFRKQMVAMRKAATKKKK